MIALVAEHEIDHVSVAGAFLLALLALAACGLPLIALQRRGQPCLAAICRRVLPSTYADLAVAAIGAALGRLAAVHHGDDSLDAAPLGTGRRLPEQRDGTGRGVWGGGETTGGQTQRGTDLSETAIEAALVDK